LVLIEQPRDERVKGPRPRAARAIGGHAGIAPEWWDVRGRRIHCREDTLRTLLAADAVGRHDCGRARDTLRRLSDDLDRRALPLTSVGHGGEALICDLALNLPRIAGAVVDAGTEDGGPNGSGWRRRTASW